MEDRPVTAASPPTESPAPRNRTPTVDPSSTTSASQGRRGRIWRRISIVAMVVFVGLGVADFWGTRSTSVSATDHGYRMTVTLPAVSRAGLPVAWELSLSRLNGGELPPTIELVSDAAYFALFDHHALTPTPTREWQTGSKVGWVFEVPPGAVEMTVSLDARTEPGVHRGRGGESAIVVDGVEVVAVGYETRVAP